MGGGNAGEQVIMVALVVANMMVMKVMVMVCQPTEYNTSQTLGMICKWTRVL
jgi:hypothetical protein